MQFEIYQVISLSAILFLASIIQSSVGFAFALFSTPILIWLGLPLPKTIIIVAVASFLQSIFGIKHLGDFIPWHITFISTLVRTIAVIIGLIILKIVIGFETNLIKLIVGCILTFLVLLQFTIKAHSLSKVHWVWGALSFSLSGLLSGIVGMGGPPLMLWSLAHNWTTKKIRAFLFSVYAMSFPIQILLMYLSFGRDIIFTTIYAFIFIPAVLLGSLIGLPLGNKIPKTILRNIVYLILLVIGLSSVIPALIQFL